MNDRDFEQLRKNIDSARELTKYAVYPDVGNNVWYPMLGLVDELAEWARAPVRRKKDEFLDVFWYYNQLVWELREAGIYPRPWGMHLQPSHMFASPNSSLAFIGCGTLAGVVKKYVRDGEGSITDRKRLLVADTIQQFGSVMCIWRDLEGTLWRLHEKLGDRQDRGQLHGDGDYR